MVCRDFILPEPASYVFFYAFSNLRNLLYIISFSATARPHDNAVAEAFFASFKKEEAYRREYASEQSYRKSVAQYVQFYNELRPHRTLKYKTPQAFEEAYWASLS